MSEHTEQDTSSRRLWSNVLISMSFSEKRVKQGYRGTQVEAMESCDFLFFSFSWIRMFIMIIVWLVGANHGTLF